MQEEIYIMITKVYLIELNLYQILDIYKIMNLKEIINDSTKIVFYGETTKELAATIMAYFNNLLSKKACDFSIINENTIVYENGINNKEIDNTKINNSKVSKEEIIKENYKNCKEIEELNSL